MPLTPEQLERLKPGTPLIWRRKDPNCSWARKIMCSVQYLEPHNGRAAVFGVNDQARHYVELANLCVDDATNIKFVPTCSQRRSATLEHVLLLAPCRIPRIKRNLGQLLCGSSDANYADPVGTPVTCPRCRELLSRVVGLRGTH